MEYERLGQEERGKFMRDKGLHEAHLGRWKKEVLEGLKLKPFAMDKKDPQRKRIVALEKKLRSKEVALAETAALLVLKSNRRDLGSSGIETAQEDRLWCRELIGEEVDSGARLWRTCEVIGIIVRTY